MAHSTVDRVLREFIELLHSFAVDIDLTGFAENAYEAGLVYFTRNDFRSQSKAGQEGREISGRSGIQSLFIENVLLNRLDLAHLHPSSSGTLAYTFVISEELSFYLLHPSWQPRQVGLLLKELF